MTSPFEPAKFMAFVDSITLDFGQRRSAAPEAEQRNRIRQLPSKTGLVFATKASYARS
jgi:hypothetical protein